MKSNMFRTAVFLAVFLSLTVFSGAGSIATAQEPEGESQGSALLKDFEIESYTGWESKYAAEGRDDLPDSGIYVFGASLGYKGVSVAFDFTGGDEEGYSEVNYGIGYGIEYADFEFGVGYTRLEFRNDPEAAGDNEYSVEIGYGGIPFIAPSAAFVYADEDKGGRTGSFLELGIAGDLSAVIPAPVSITPYISQSFDFGYRTDENDGLNNFQIGVEAAINLLENVSLVAHINHSFKQKDVKEEIREGERAVAAYNAAASAVDNGDPTDDEQAIFDEGEPDSPVKAAGTWGGLSLVVSL